MDIYSILNALATALYVSSPSIKFPIFAKHRFDFNACFQPILAILSTYGNVTLVSAKVEV